METTNIELLKNICELSSLTYLQGVVDAHHIHDSSVIEEIRESNEFTIRLNDEIHTLTPKQYSTIVMEAAKTTGMHYIYNYMLNVFGDEYNMAMMQILHHIYKMGMRDFNKYEIYNLQDQNALYKLQKRYMTPKGYVDLDTYCSMIRRYITEIQINYGGSPALDKLDAMITVTIKNKNEIIQLEKLNNEYQKAIEQRAKVSGE